ncbi:helix-turn-helix protein [Micromonospora pisi]|uniref:Helix-turn-helix protein n=1 Tax=Micromonospora pisi TaxID=589240 RepID=A0A495JJF7_9ACTN|nr:helix-turn-helix domain-containing protein [Micromonospora pisi]RKR88452.1 helix-turn-helix protein [Micromonospora pisi]
MPQPAVGDIRDPRMLRAMAHPLRLRILDAVAFCGSATATEVAEQVGESPANCSWHLRQLARYGFVEEAGGGTGRQRPWRIVLDRHRWGPGGAESTRVGQAAHQVLLDVEYQALREWLGNRHEESPQWRGAGFLTQAVGWCTPAQLAEIGAAINEVLARRLPDPIDPEARPLDSRPVRFIAWGVPARPSEPATADDG